MLNVKRRSNEKKYINQIHTDVSFKPKDIIGLINDYFKIKSKLRPIKNLPIVLSNKDNESLESVTWFGHSASLLKIEGKTLLLDPMFGDASSRFLCLIVNVIVVLFL